MAGDRLSERRPPIDRARSWAAGGQSPVAISERCSRWPRGELRGSRADNMALCSRASSARAERARSRSMTFRSSPRRSNSRRCRSIARRSSSGTACSASQARSFGPHRSAWGQEEIRWPCRIDCMMFFSRDRCRTIWLRRVTWRRSAWVGSSGIQTSGRKPLAKSCASTPASIVSVLIFDVRDDAGWRSPLSSRGAGQLPRPRPRCRSPQPLRRRRPRASRRTRPEDRVACRRARAA